nr:ethylene-responsive transcription factor ERF073-like [Ipomoea trifida]
MVEGETRGLRKVTIRVSDPDPYATESSSDESDREKRPKGVVGEVFIPKRRNVPGLGRGHGGSGVRRSETLWSGGAFGWGLSILRRRRRGPTFPRSKNSRKSREPNREQRVTQRRRFSPSGFSSAKRPENSTQNSQTEKNRLGPFETAEEASQVYQSKKNEFEESKKPEFEESKVSQCEESEWVSMPDGSEVCFSVKYGIPIIDNYGRLMSEFRSLDDDLWICGPEDDDNQPSQHQFPGSIFVSGNHGCNGGLDLCVSEEKAEQEEEQMVFLEADSATL